MLGMGSGHFRGEQQKPLVAHLSGQLLLTFVAQIYTLSGGENGVKKYQKWGQKWIKIIAITGGKNYVEDL